MHIANEFRSVPKLCVGEQAPPLSVESTPPSATLVPFPNRMVSGLAAKLPGQSLIGLIGPAGSGKLTLLKPASALPKQVYDLDSTRANMKRLIQDLQPMLDGPRVFALCGTINCLAEALARKMVAKTTLSSRVVRMSKENIRAWIMRCITGPNGL